MIVVDTSALIAILDKEPDASRYAEAIAEADPPLISIDAMCTAKLFAFVSDIRHIDGIGVSKTLCFQLTLTLPFGKEEAENVQGKNGSKVQDAPRPFLKVGSALHPRRGHFPQREGAKNYLSNGDASRQRC